MQFLWDVIVHDFNLIKTLYCFLFACFDEVGLPYLKGSSGKEPGDAKRLSPARWILSIVSGSWKENSLNVHFQCSLEKTYHQTMSPFQIYRNNEVTDVIENSSFLPIDYCQQFSNSLRSVNIFFVICCYTYSTVIYLYFSLCFFIPLLLIYIRFGSNLPSSL